MVWLLAQLRSSARERLAADLVAAAPPPEPEPIVPWRYRRSVRRSPRRRRPPVARACDRPSVPAVATMPVWRERPTVEDAGVVGWFRGLLETRPIRPDRSRSARPEGGGRLDRLDLWLLVVLVVATMGMRTFRLAEPYQMHFDEVYHARTATEFLQSWRYGISHDIYEWTHPHLAKYAMAGGLVLWGQDDVSATSELGHAGHGHGRRTAPRRPPGRRSGR